MGCAFKTGKGGSRPAAPRPGLVQKNLWMDLRRSFLGLIQTRLLLVLSLGEIRSVAKPFVCTINVGYMAICLS